MKRRLAILLSLAVAATSAPQSTIFAEDLFTDSVPVADETQEAAEVTEEAAVEASEEAVFSDMTQGVEAAETAFDVAEASVAEEVPVEETELLFDDMKEVMDSQVASGNIIENNKTYTLNAMNAEKSANISFTFREIGKYEFTFSSVEKLEGVWINGSKYDLDDKNKLIYTRAMGFVDMECLYSEAGEYTVSVRKLELPELQDGETLNIDGPSPIYKIKPSETGRYLILNEYIQNDCATERECALYDKNYDCIYEGDSPVSLELTAGETYYVRVIDTYDYLGKIQSQCTFEKENIIKNITCVNPDEMNKVFSDCPGGSYEPDGIKLCVEYENGSEIIEYPSMKAKVMEIWVSKRDISSSVSDVIASAKGSNYVLYQINKLSYADFYALKKASSLTEGKTNQDYYYSNETNGKYYTFTAPTTGNYCIEFACDTEELRTAYSVDTGKTVYKKYESELNVNLKKGQILYLNIIARKIREGHEKRLDVTVSKRKDVVSVTNLTPARGGVHYNKYAYDMSGLNVRLNYSDGTSEKVAYDSDAWHKYKLFVVEENGQLMLGANGLGMQLTALYPVKVYKSLYDYVPYMENANASGEYTFDYMEGCHRITDMPKTYYIAFKAKEAGKYLLSSKGLIDEATWEVSVHVKSQGEGIAYDEFGFDDAMPMKFNCAKDDIVIARIDSYGGMPNVKFLFKKLCTEHKYDEGVMDFSGPICESSGRIIYTCTVCNNREKVYFEEGLGHIPADSFVIERKSTQTAEGSKYHPCERDGCSAKLDVTTIDKLPKNGTILTNGSLKYKVTSAGKGVVYVSCLKPATSSLTKVVIPEQFKLNDDVVCKVTSIAEKAFYKNTKITSVEIGKNVKTIGKYAFYGCSKLKTVSMKTSILRKIDYKAFYGCKYLEKITIPEDVEYIGKQAFYGCKNLKNLYIKTTKLTSKNVGSSAFKGIYSKVSIKVPSKKYNSYKTLLKSKGAPSTVKYGKL